MKGYKKKINYILGLVLLGLTACGGGSDGESRSNTGSSNTQISYTNRLMLINNKGHTDDYGNTVDPNVDFNIVEIRFAGNASSSSAKRKIMGTSDSAILPFGTRNFNISKEQLKQYDYWPGHDSGPTDGKVVICMVLQDKANYFYASYKEFSTSGATSMAFYPRANTVKFGRFGCGGSGDAVDGWREWLDAPSFADNY